MNIHTANNFKFYKYLKEDVIILTPNFPISTSSPKMILSIINLFNLAILLLKYKAPYYFIPLSYINKFNTSNYGSVEIAYAIDL